MKAEINKNGLLTIIHESKEEKESLEKWTKENNGKIYITELAMTEFKSVKIAFSGLSWERWGIVM